MNTIKVLDHGFVTLRNISGPTHRTWGLDGGDGWVGAFCADSCRTRNNQHANMI